MDSRISVASRTMHTSSLRQQETPSVPDGASPQAQDFFLKSKAMKTFQNSALDKLEEFKNANNGSFRRPKRPNKPTDEAAGALVSRMDILASQRMQQRTSSLSKFDAASTSSDFQPPSTLGGVGDHHDAPPMSPSMSSISVQSPVKRPSATIGLPTQQPAPMDHMYSSPALSAASSLSRSQQLPPSMFFSGSTQHFNSTPQPVIGSGGFPQVQPSQPQFPGSRPPPLQMSALSSSTSQFSDASRQPSGGLISTQFNDTTSVVGGPASPALSAIYMSGMPVGLQQQQQMQPQRTDTILAAVSQPQIQPQPSLLLQLSSLQPPAPPMRIPPPPPPPVAQPQPPLSFPTPPLQPTAVGQPMSFDQRSQVSGSNSQFSTSLPQPSQPQQPSSQPQPMAAVAAAVKTPTSTRALDAATKELLSDIIGDDDFDEIFEMAQLDLSKKESIERLFRDVVESEARAKMIEEELTEEKRLCDELEKCFLDITRDRDRNGGFHLPSSLGGLTLKSPSSADTFGATAPPPLSSPLLSMNSPAPAGGGGQGATPATTSDQNRVEKMTNLIREQMKQKYLGPLKETQNVMKATQQAIVASTNLKSSMRSSGFEPSPFGFSQTSASPTLPHSSVDENELAKLTELLATLESHSQEESGEIQKLSGGGGGGISERSLSDRSDSLPQRGGLLSPGSERSFGVGIGSSGVNVLSYLDKFVNISIGKGDDDENGQANPLDLSSASDQMGGGLLPSCTPARCVRSRAATVQGELTVISGEEIKVLDAHESGLWIAENASGDVGLVPREHLQLLTTAPMVKVESSVLEVEHFPHSPQPKQQQQLQLATQPQEEDGEEEIVISDSDDDTDPQMSQTAGGLESIAERFKAMPTGGQHTATSILKDAKTILKSTEGSDVQSASLPSDSTSSERAILMILQKGAIFKKHGGESGPVDRLVLLTGDLRFLCWKAADRKGPQSRQAIQIASICELRRGLSPSYLDSLSPEQRADLATRERCCFCVATKARTVELEARSEDACEGWVYALHYLLRNRERLIQ